MGLSDVRMTENEVTGLIKFYQDAWAYAIEKIFS